MLYNEKTGRCLSLLIIGVGIFFLVMSIFDIKKRLPLPFCFLDYAQSVLRGILAAMICAVTVTVILMIFADRATEDKYEVHTWVCAALTGIGYAIGSYRQDD